MKWRNKKGQFVKGHKFPSSQIGRIGYWHGKKRPDISIAHMGAGNPMWRGDKVSNAGLHLWLRVNYGNPKKCEFCNSKNEICYDWALKSGLQYERKRENFLRLCRSCHMRYDYKNGSRAVYYPTQEVKEKIRKSVKIYVRKNKKKEG